MKKDLIVKPQVLITGASKGIGLAIAKKISNDYRLILQGRDEATINDIKNSLEGDQHQVCVGSLDTLEGIDSFIRDVKKLIDGDFYGLINNAGSNYNKPILFQPNSEILEILKVNLLAPILLSKCAIKSFKRSNKGIVINMSSILADHGNAFQVAYSASKSGLNAVTRSLAREVGELDAENNIRIVGVAPGFIDTDMTKKLPEEIKEAYKKHIPLKKFGRPEDVAELIHFLLDETKSKYINGSIVKIDGGFL